MRAVIQRVSHAKVLVDGKLEAEIGKGLLVLCGFLSSDEEKVLDYMLDKIVNLRIFEDEEEKMNLSLLDIQGDLLLVPNFTLYGDARKGRRPGFSAGAKPQEARAIFESLQGKAKQLEIKTGFGVFQAHMEVTLTNDGPVTILLDSEKLF